MFWIVVGYGVASFGLLTLAYFSDWPGAERDSYFRNVGAFGGFLTVLGLFCILYGASVDGSPLAFPAIVLALVTGAAGAWFLRRRRRVRNLDLVRPDEDGIIKPP